MQTSGKSLFASVIEDHLALKRKNAALEMSMPLDRFIPADPFDNHSLFKSEYDARLEEEETGEHPAITLEWSGTRRRANWKMYGSIASSARSSTGATSPRSS